MKEVLYIVLESMRYLGIILQAFIPDTATKILDALKVDEKNRNFKNLTEEFAIQNSQIHKPEAVFIKI